MYTAQLIRQAGSSSSGSSVPGQRAVMRTLPAAAESVPKLRSFAQTTVRGWDMGDDAEDALAVIVSELVANACQHSGSPEVTVLLLAGRGHVVVHVSDTGMWKQTSAQLPNDEATSGRGLQLVRAYASDIHVHRSSQGTKVTATVAASEPASLALSH